MFVEMMMRFIMELIMIAPFWLITYLAFALFAEKYNDDAGKYVIDCMRGNYIFYNSFMSVILASTGAFTTGFFAGMPDMRVVIVCCFLGVIAYSVALHTKYKEVSVRFKQRAEAKSKMHQI